MTDFYSTLLSYWGFCVAKGNTDSSPGTTVIPSFRVEIWAETELFESIHHGWISTFSMRICVKELTIGCSWSFMIGSVLRVLQLRLTVCCDWQFVMIDIDRGGWLLLWTVVTDSYVSQLWLTGVIQWWGPWEMVDRDTPAIPAAIKFTNFLHLEVVVTLTNLPHTA